jgi:hypothetical protein
MMRACERIWQRYFVLSKEVMSQTKGCVAAAGRPGTDHFIVKRAKKSS